MSDDESEPFHLEFDGLELSPGSNGLAGYEGAPYSAIYRQLR
jgi:hypothetical protein